MKTYLKDIKPVKNKCVGCQVGYCWYSRGKDENGEYIETNSCHDPGKCRRAVFEVIIEN